jgi:ribonuclease P/MRP protein subunit POP7
MASQQPGKDSSKQVPGTMVKLAPIPDGARVQKRALNRRQLPASAKSRIVYVSSSTPFMSAVKRIRKQLDAALRSTATSSAGPGAGLGRKEPSLHDRVEALRHSRGGGDGGGDGPVVTVMGTGRAVEKTLGVAGWFQQQPDCVVELRTRTVGTVDDVIIEDEDVEDSSRIRKLSCLEVIVRLR